MKRLIPIFIFASFAITSVLAQQVNVQRYVDWAERQIVFVLSTAVDHTSLPCSKQQAEGVIEREKIPVILENMADFCFDDLESIAISMNTNYKYLDLDLNSAVQAVTKEQVVFSDDMCFVQVTYILPFSALTSCMVRSHLHTPPFYIAVKQKFNYTGIIIDATDALPVQNNLSTHIHVNQTLLPSLKAADGRNLITPYSVKEAFFKKWGTVGYSSSLNEKTWPVDRIGKHPLIIPASKISGDNHSTLEITDRYANLLLSSPEGYRLLQEGRVLFLVAPTDPHAKDFRSQTLISSIERRLLN